MYSARPLFAEQTAAAPAVPQSSVFPPLIHSSALQLSTSSSIYQSLQTFIFLPGSFSANGARSTQETIVLAVFLHRLTAFFAE